MDEISRQNKGPAISGAFARDDQGTKTEVVVAIVRVIPVHVRKATVVGVAAVQPPPAILYLKPIYGNSDSSPYNVE